ncbi:type II toxin-antitoxin system prevent-host-death family antitoxin [Streptomyces rubiginosohelvolus]|uniref:type II toxin-antitoxin system prevent-host-death family antitoxin n=1 Tax=Streptomyces rubiginosohelvolus TaxID=67362 RepID=UPI00371DB067
MEMTSREFTRCSAQVLAAAERGETITVTVSAAAVARVVPISHHDVLPYPTDPMGAIQLPDLGLPDLTDEELES